MIPALVARQAVWLGTTPPVRNDDPGRSQLTIVPGSGHYVEFDFASQSAALAAFLASTIGPESTSP